MRRRLAAGLAGLMAMVLPSCGSSTPPATPPGSAAAGLSGSLIVFAAASLTEAFNDAKTGLVADNPRFSLAYSFAGSQQLVAQITNGAPADVVATADQDSMSKLVAGSLVEPPTDFAANSLQIVVAAGNPNAVRGLPDLARANLKVVLADASVPAGKYARQALDKAGTTVKPVSLELDVKAVLRKVSSGEADAGIVYLSDVAAAGHSVTGVDIPPAQNVIATYPVAVVKGTPNRGAAQAFVDQLLHGRGRDALTAHGFRGV